MPDPIIDSFLRSLKRQGKAKTIREISDDVKQNHPNVKFSTVGQGNHHAKKGLDHSNATDIAVDPNSPEGQAIKADLDRMGVPYLASNGTEKWSTGKHFHVGDISSRTSQRVAPGTTGDALYPVEPSSTSDDPVLDALRRSEQRRAQSPPPAAQTSETDSTGDPVLDALQRSEQRRSQSSLSATQTPQTPAPAATPTTPAPDIIIRDPQGNIVAGTPAEESPLNRVLKQVQQEQDAEADAPAVLRSTSSLSEVGTSDATATRPRTSNMFGGQVTPTRATPGAMAPDTRDSLLSYQAKFTPEEEAQYARATPAERRELFYAAIANTFGADRDTAMKTISRIRQYEPNIDPESEFNVGSLGEIRFGSRVPRLVEAMKRGGVQEFDRQYQKERQDAQQYSTEQADKAAANQAEIEQIKKDFGENDNTPGGKAGALAKIAGSSLAQQLLGITGGAADIAGALAGKVGLDELDRSLSGYGDQQQAKQQTIQQGQEQVQKQTNLPNLSASMARLAGQLPVIIGSSIVGGAPGVFTTGMLGSSREEPLKALANTYVDALSMGLVGGGTGVKEIAKGVTMDAASDVLVLMPDFVQLASAKAYAQQNPKAYTPQQMAEIDKRLATVTADAIAATLFAVGGEAVSSGRYTALRERLAQNSRVYNQIMSDPDVTAASASIDQARAAVADLTRKQQANQTQLQKGLMPPFSNVEPQLQAAQVAEAQAVANYDATLKGKLPARWENDNRSILQGLFPQKQQPQTAAADVPPPQTTPAESVAENDFVARMQAIAQTGEAPKPLARAEQIERFNNHPEAEALIEQLGENVNTPKGAQAVDKLIQRLKKQEGFSDIVAEDITSQYLSPEQNQQEIADAKAQRAAAKQAKLEAQAEALRQAKAANPEAAEAEMPITSEGYEQQGERLNKWLDEYNADQERSAQAQAIAMERVNTLTLYHGTNAAASFDSPRGGSFFTDAAANAHKYSNGVHRTGDEPTGESRVYTAKLKVKKPFVVRDHIALKENTLFPERVKELEAQGYDAVVGLYTVGGKDVTVAVPFNDAAISTKNVTRSRPLLQPTAAAPVDTKPVSIPNQFDTKPVTPKAKYGIDTELRAKIKNPRWKPLNLESGGRDSSFISSKDLSLPNKPKPQFTTDSNAMPANVPLSKIWLGEKALNREQLLTAAENLKDGYQPATRAEDAIIVTPDPKNPDNFIVLSGQHRIAAGKLMDFNGNVPVIVRTPNPETPAAPAEKPAGSLFGESITRDPEYIAQQQRANEREKDAKWTTRARIQDVLRIEPEAFDASAFADWMKESEFRATEKAAETFPLFADEIRGQINEQANEAATSPKNDLPEPSEGQILAGNYKKGHIKWNGLDISIENPLGSTRSGKDEDGEMWSVTMTAHYGYLKRTEGADGEHVDVYIGPNPESDRVFVVNQVDAKTKAFDEHKAILGINSIEKASALYDAHFSDGKGKDRRQSVVEVSTEDFKRWLKYGNTKAPIGPSRYQIGDIVEINDPTHGKVTARVSKIVSNDNGIRGYYNAEIITPDKTVKKADRKEAGDSIAFLQGEGVQFVSTPPATDNQPLTTDQPSITVRRNEAQNGIEIKFNTKPDAGTIKRLKDMGFRWSTRGHWYAKQSPKRNAFADQFAAKASPVEATTATPTPTLAPTLTAAELGYKKRDIWIHTDGLKGLMGEKTRGRNWRQSVEFDLNNIDRALRETPQLIDSIDNHLIKSARKALEVERQRPTEQPPRRETLADSSTAENAAGQAIKQTEENKTIATTTKGNPATYNGKAFWIGTANTLDGIIENTYTRETAQNSDYHHSLYMSKADQEGIDNGERVVFWVDDDGSIQANWRESASPELIEKIRLQIKTTIPAKQDGPKPILSSTQRFDAENGSQVTDNQSLPTDQQIQINEQALPTTTNQRPFHNLANKVEETLRAGQRLDNPTLDKLAEQSYGGKVSEGAYSFKDAYDAVETAVNRIIRDKVPQLEKLSFPEAIGEIEAIMAQLPTQDPKRRSKEQQDLQQFSTPPTLGYLAARMLDIRPGETALEPSAGTGNLAVIMQGLGADVHANEIDPRRAEALRSLGFETTSFDGEYINNELSDNIQPSVILMNPPFSATGGRVKQNSSVFGMAHIEQAAARLAKNGRLVAIMGEGTGPNMPKQEKIWQRLANKYMIRAVVPLSGENYRKYGTTYDNVLLILDKVGPTPGNTWQQQKANIFSPTEFRNYADAYIALETIRDSRQLPNASKSPVARDLFADIEPSTPLLDQQPNDASPSRMGTATTAPATNAGMGTQSNSSRNDGRSGTGGRGGRIRSTEPVQLTRNDAQPATIQSNTPAPSGQPQPAGNAPTIARDSGRSNSAVANPLRNPEQHKLALANRQTVGAYTDYIPQRIIGPGKDPSPYVEPTTLAYVDLPEVEYDLNIPQKGKDVLSLAQYEAVTYIGARHQRILPDGSRAGFSIGDGTGVGKSFTIAATILDNWNRGVKKMIWLTVNDDRLVPGINAALKELGAGDIPIKSLKDFKTGDTIDHAGILTSSYTAIGQRFNTVDSRIPQLIKWLGEDSLIIMDEAHKAGNAYVEDLAAVFDPEKDAKLNEGSKTGQAAITLQHALSKARVLYATATQAVEPRQMAYMTRLGLWGKGTPFPTFADFQKAIEGQGLSAMEQVVRDMKADGSYMARMLKMSHDPETNTAVEVKQTVHELDEAQTLAYDTAAKAWRVVLANIDQAIEVTGNAKNAKQQAYNAFWSTHQRFFSGLMASFKLPTLVGQAQQALQDGRQVVIAVTKTGEAQLERRVNDIERQLNSDQLTYDKNRIPMEGTGNQMANTLKRLVRKSFPVAQYQEITDENGTKRKVIMADNEGNAVENKEAVKLRDDLLASIDDLFEVVNASSNVTGAFAALDPIDQVIEYFKGQGIEVGEVTGRKSRQIVDDQGRVFAVKRGGANKASLADMNAFQQGRKKVVIINATAAEGYNLHADRRSPSAKARREMIYLEVPWSSIQIAQANGRVNRTNQASKPINHLIGINVPGDIRFMATAAKRLASMGAMSSGQRDAVGESSQFADYDVLNKYGRMTADDMLRVLPVSDWEEMGLVKTTSEGAKTKPETIRPEIFFNRVLAMPVEAQNRIVETFMDRYKERIQNAINSGSYDTGVKTIEAEDLRRATEDVVVAEDENTGAQTKYATFEGERPLYSMDWNTIEGLDFTKRAQYFRNKRSGKMYQAEPVYEYPKGAGFVLNSTTTRNYKKIFGDEANNYQPVGKDEAKGLWNAEVATLPKTKTDTFHVLHGKLIGLWDEITNKGDELASIKQLITKDGERVIGAIVPKDKIEKILQAFTERNTVADPVEKFKELAKNNDLRLGAGTHIETTRMQNQNYFRIFPGSRMLGAEIAQHPDIPSIYNYGNAVPYIPNDPIKGPQALASLYDLMGLKVKRAGADAIDARRAEVTRRSADALARLRQREAGYINADLLIPDFIPIALEKLAQGVKTFKPFADEMIRTFGEKIKNIRKALRPAWEQAIKFWQDERGAMTADLSPLPDDVTPKRAPKSAPGVPSHFDLADYTKKALKAIKKAELSEEKTQAAHAKLEEIAHDIFRNDGRAMIQHRRELTELLETEAPSFKSVKGIKKGLLEAANLPRAIKASIDLSAPLRQGAIETLNIWNLRPGRAREVVTNIGKMLSSTGRDSYLNFEAEIAAHPRAELADKAGLYRASSAELDFETKLTQREEQYLTKLAGKIPLVSHSERAYKAFLDSQRMQAFDRLATELERAGYTPEKDIRPFEEIADFINKATGRGTIPAMMESMAPLLNSVLFSPRYLASRFQLFDPRNYVNAIPGINFSSTNFYSKPVAKNATKEMFGYLAAVSAVSALAMYAGAIVSFDPDDPDFLKPRWDKYRYDLLAGLQQEGRFLWRLAGSFHNGRKDAMSVTAHFLRGKLAPIPGIATDIWTGKTFTGDTPTVGGEFANLIAPLMMKDLYEGYMESGITGAAKMLPGLVGVGVQQYEKKGTENGFKLPERGKRNGIDEPADIYKKRTDRAKQWHQKFGQALLDNPKFKAASPEDQKRLREVYQRRVTKESGKTAPNTGRLQTSVILEALRQSKEKAKTPDPNKLWR